MKEAKARKQTVELNNVLAWFKYKYCSGMLLGSWCLASHSKGIFSALKAYVLITFLATIAIWSSLESLLTALIQAAKAAEQIQIRFIKPQIHYGLTLAKPKP